jgi:hypothetical protein
MKRLVFLSLAFALLMGAALSVSAQKATRITFKKGAHSAVVTGTLNGFKGKRVFVIRVRAGQAMTTEDIGTNPVTLWIEGPPGSNYEQDMAADCHSRNEITPTDAGDYKITVVECEKADPWKGTFKFRVKVR